MLTDEEKFNIVILFIFQSNENIPADIDSVPCLERSWPGCFNLLASSTKICNYNLKEN